MPGAIIFPLFLRLRVDGRKRFEYATCGRNFFHKRRKKTPFSKISAYVWTGPKCINNLIPDYLRNMFVPRSYVHNRSTRSGTENKLNIPKCLLATGQRSFSYRGCKLWNDLSMEI